MEHAVPGTRTDFNRDGFTVAPFVLDPELVGRVSLAMDRVMAADYETGKPPISRSWNPGDDEIAIRKIDGAQVSDPAIFEFVSDARIGAWAAEMMDASMIRLWTCQMLYKPPSAERSANVGWHQDDQYWLPMVRGQSFTVWVAVSDVTDESGPLLYVKGSNHWGPRHGGDFFSGDLEEIKQRVAPEGREWIETAAVLPPGGMTIHERMTLHGSASNTSEKARRGFALHLMTENAEPVETSDDPFFRLVDDRETCPVLFDAR